MSTPAAADATTLAWHAFTALAEVQRRRTLALARDLDLSPPQMWALRYLVPGEPRPMGELTTALVCESSNVTGISDRLEARGLVRREPYPRDRRVRALVLTDAGVAVRDEIIRRVAEPAPGFDALGVAEAARLAALLARIAESVVGADGLALPAA
jgi:MarR family transcriptional regulator, organic hydroperoxide resistance regulator